MKRNFAFSLVELLISLIIISLVIAAFAPVMTRKFTQTIGLTTSRKFEEALLTYGNDRKASLYDCKISEDEKYADCKFVVPEGVSELVAVIVGGGGGGASGVSAFVEKDIIASSDNLNTSTIETQNIVTIEDGMRNVVITNLIGGGGGGGAGFWGDTEENEFIDACPANTVRVTANDEAEYCVTKYNVRPVSLAQYHNSQAGVVPTKSTVFDLEIPIPVPENYFNFASGDTPSYYGDYNSPTNTAPACWVSPSTNCSSNGIYSGCGRTVCNWYAAEAMCKVIDMGGKCNAKGTRDGIFEESCKDLWRIPTSNEAAYYPQLIFSKDYSGLNSLSLCDNGSKSPACLSISNTALSSYQNLAFPAGIWGGSHSDTHAGLTYINNGGLTGIYDVPKIAARSVRCVLKAKDSRAYIFASGSCGTTGTGIINTAISIPNDIIKANIGAQIKLTAGKGGKGGGSREDSSCPVGDSGDCNVKGGGCVCIDEIGAPGKDGEYSSVTVEKNGQILWGYRVKGGYHGWQAWNPKNGVVAPRPFSKRDNSGNPVFDSTTNKGVLDEEKQKPICEQYDTNEKKWKAFACPNEAKIDEGQFSTGRICDPTTGACPQGYLYGGRHIFPDGTTLNYGGGGKPGYGWFKHYNTTWAGVYNKGDDGVNGVATIKYDKITSRGVAGGGGGGACAARIEHISVKSGDEFKIRIGAGGLGGISREVGEVGLNGEVGNDGSDGGATVIELPSVFKITALGGLKGITGTNSNKNNVANGSGSGVVDCTSVSDDLIPENIKKNIVFFYTGKEGSAGVFEEETEEENEENNKTDDVEISKASHAIGGTGGIAGFYQISGYTYTQGGCGGYSDLGLCASNPNKYNYGLSPEAFDPFKLYSGKTYGTFGSGGGGGGWLYDFEKNERAGSGGRGLDGYVYLYWYR